MSIQSPTKESQEAMQAKTQAIPPRNVGDSLPEGGTVGQVLTKTATGAAWDDVPEELPTEGTAGQVLTLEVPEGETDPVPTWADPEEELPSGGTAGQVLTKTANGCEWAAAAGGELKPQLTNKIVLTLSTTYAVPVIIGGRVLGTNNANRFYTVSSTSNFSTSKNHTAGSVTPFVFDATDASTTNSLYPRGRLVGRSYTDIVIPDTDPEVYYLLGSDSKELVYDLSIRLNDASRTQVGKLMYTVKESFAAKKWNVELRPICIYWYRDVSSEDSLTLGLNNNGIVDSKYLDDATCYAIKDDAFELYAGRISNIFTESSGQTPFKTIVLFE